MSVLLDLFYLILPALLLVSSLEVLELAQYLRHTTSKENYKKMYPVWRASLVVILMLNITIFLREFTDYTSFHRLVEISVVVFFLGTMIMIRKRVVTVEILMNVADQLQERVNEKTEELKEAKEKLENYSKTLEKSVEERTKNLQSTVAELVESRTALINMMEDSDAVNKTLREAVNRLTEVDRLKDQLLSNVSHELRTPITIVKSALELMLDEDLNEEERNLITMAKSNLNRLDALVGDLLYFSRGEQEIPLEEIEKVSVQDLANAAVESMSHMAKTHNISLVSKVDDDLPNVEVSRTRILQVLTNLIGNSIKFNNENGSVTIDATYKPDDIEITLSVSDTGVGIPKNQLNKIFERFYQVDGSTSRKYGGTGLGLAITKSIVETHGGRIWVDSEVGKGTTFYFTLPIKRKKGYIITFPIGEGTK